ncbi:MAG: TraR/DksA C4-type zinc finger protein [Rhodospirillales bacterium]|nr:TraR/DksA C4-type zinc finger protein [Rhodospirillales bacterium]
MSERTDLDMVKLKAKLVETREELLSVAETSTESKKPVELDQTTQGRLSRMDALQVQAMAVETDRRRLVEIQRIEAALKRIDEDDYGYCASCDEEIPAKRLEFDPAAAVCIDCAK